MARAALTLVVFGAYDGYPFLTLQFNSVVDRNLPGSLSYFGIVRIFCFQANYIFLLSVEEEILKALTAGAKLCDVYEAGVEFVKKEKPKLVDNLTKSFG